MSDIIESGAAETTPEVGGDEPLWTRRQTARVLGVCDDQVTRMVAAGKLAVIKFGGDRSRSHFRPSDVRALIAQSRKA